MTSLYPWSYNCLASATMVSGLLLLSLPLVNGTTQKEHILSQPRIMEINPDTPLLSNLTGLISAYVSSLDKRTFTLL